MDVGQRASLRSKLGDRGPAGRLLKFAPLADAGPALSRVDRQKLSAADRIHYDTVKWASDIALEMRGFPYGGVDSYGYPVPYVLSQLTGSYQSIPDFMDSQHPVAKRSDAEAYLDRLEAFARNIDHETGRAKADHGRGVTPPDFVIDRTLVQLASLRGATGEANVLVASIERRGAAFGGGWGAKAQKIFDGKIAPAGLQKGRD